MVGSRVWRGPAESPDDGLISTLKSVRSQMQGRICGQLIRSMFLARSIFTIVSISVLKGGSRVAPVGLKGKRSRTVWFDVRDPAASFAHE
jgi:hypothetical protein